MPRLFIALDLPEELKQKLGELKYRLNFTQARWVKEENLHLTLKFLGQVEEEKISSISALLVNSLSDFPCFNLQTAELSVFPALKRARVLWINLVKGRKEAKNLAGLIESKLFTLGFEKENREFEPHITLARFRKPVCLSSLPSVGFSFSFFADQVVLFESILKPSGPIYKIREVFPLKGAA